MGADLGDLYDAGLRGDIAAVEAALAEVSADRSGLGAAWRAALRALLWFASSSPDPRELPDERELSAFRGASPEARAIASRACAHLARARLLAFDREGLDRSAELLAALASPGESADWAAIARGLSAIARGSDVEAELEAVEQRGRESGRADLVLEATTVRALGAATAGDIERALALGRRASRMARTESMPQLEYFAHLVLARIRRLSGKPYLATRIVSALRAVATAPWQPWLGWELVLAHGDAGDALDLPRAATTPASASSDAIGAARRGDRAQFHRAAESAWRAVETVAPFADDLYFLLAAIDPRAELRDAPPALARFCSGEDDEPPRGLGGACGAGDGDTTAWVLAIPRERARRVLAPGVGLVRAEVRGVVQLEGEPQQLRTGSAVAALALGGAEGLDEHELFRRLYGFDYEAGRHQAVRGVLYGRVRERLGGHGELVREDGRIRIVHDAPILLPDPRCTPPTELRIVSILAERRVATPRDVASALGIPLRTAQDVLRKLLDDGALRSEKASRGLHYILEDTTFSEPTRNVRR